jgi:hypothetical protein
MFGTTQRDLMLDLLYQLERRTGRISNEFPYQKPLRLPGCRSWTSSRNPMSSAWWRRCLG